MDADAMRSARIGGVGSGKYWNVGGFQLRDGLLGIFFAERGCEFRETTASSWDVVAGEVGREAGIGRERLAARSAADTFQHVESGNHEGVMRGDELGEVRLRGRYRRTDARGRRLRPRSTARASCCVPM